MINQHFTVFLIAIACLFSSTLSAQKNQVLGKQFLLGTSVNGNPGWNDPEGERFSLTAWNLRGAVGITRRLFVGAQSRLFWSQANELPVVQTWLGGGFARFYLFMPRGEKRRWAFATELGYYWGNHYRTEEYWVNGVVKKPGQSMPNLGFSLEMRVYKNLWIEAAHNFLLVGPYDFTAYPSLGLVWHWGKFNAFSTRGLSVSDSE
ncbi:MAG: hypothetical protein J0M29_20715 [Chitinophagales bacterium]|nr:hypothetical protein [Chitinophagales bacterium]